ncbi:hypothetical protein BH10ACT3_BH10ACT3_15250 [soil metagenome]
MSTPQGWYPDTTGRHQLRWWTGKSWAAAVVDDGAQSYDAEGLTDPRAPVPRAGFTAEEFAAVRQDCGVAALPGDDPFTAPVLSIWRRQGGLVDLDPTWSVHDGLGRWLGTFRLSVTGTAPDDRRYVLHGWDGSSTVFAPAHPTALAVATARNGETLGSIVTERGGPQLEATIDQMLLARVAYSIGTVEVVALSGTACGRLVPPSLDLRRKISKRCGWAPVLMAEQLGDPDPLTARAVNLIALNWEHLIPAGVG